MGFSCSRGSSLRREAFTLPLAVCALGDLAACACLVKLSCFLESSRGRFVIAFGGVSDAAIIVKCALFKRRQLSGAVYSLDVLNCGGFEDKIRSLMRGHLLLFRVFACLEST